MNVTIRSLALLSVLMFLVPAAAQARETELLLSAKEAAESETGKAKLYSVPFYLKGQSHPSVAKTISEMTTENSTRGAFRADDESCQVAFLSAIRELQSEAQEKGGDAVIDIVSITWEKQTESATEFRCVAGTFVVHVALKGTIVKLK
jgi:uncharacterized protein YbjQ (UPF0145 family)